MMEKNSQVYQLLTLICMSGECSEKAISIFIPDQAQRNRLLAKLIANKLGRVLKLPTCVQSANLVK